MIDLRRSFRKPAVWLRHRGLREQDVMLASYPRSGNSWIKFVLAELLTGREIEFESVEFLVPMVGRHGETPCLLPGAGRLVKTHEPFRDQYKKGLYLVRDVRDVLVSYYHYQRGLGRSFGGIDEFVDKFARGEVGGYGRWDEHVRSWIEARQGGREILVVKYEDLRERPVEHVRAITSFIGLKVSAASIEAAVRHNTLGRLYGKAGQSQEFFAKEYKWREDPGRIREGSGVGGWRNALTGEHLEAIHSAREVLSALGYPAV